MASGTFIVENAGSGRLSPAVKLPTATVARPPWRPTTSATSRSSCAWTSTAGATCCALPGFGVVSGSGRRIAFFTCGGSWL